jgi:hypothetical protein
MRQGRRKQGETIGLTLCCNILSNHRFAHGSDCRDESTIAEELPPVPYVVAYMQATLIIGKQTGRYMSLAPDNPLLDIEVELLRSEQKMHMIDIGLHRNYFAICPCGKFRNNILDDLSELNQHFSSVFTYEYDMILAQKFPVAG